jgi:uncharacterized membrane protein
MFANYKTGIPFYTFYLYFICIGKIANGLHLIQLPVHWFEKSLMSVLKKVILNIEFLNGAVLTPISND